MPCNNSEQGTKNIHDLAIGELLDRADEVSKSVIGSYRCEVKHASNVSLLSGPKFTAPVLSQCAKFLGIELFRDDVELFTTKKQLADRIVLKIESYFGSWCGECSMEYRNRFSSPTSLLICHSCFQGSHDCDTMKTKAEAFHSIDKALGIVWLCQHCLPLNDAAKTYYEEDKQVSEEQDMVSEEHVAANEIIAEQVSVTVEADNKKPNSQIESSNVNNTQAVAMSPNQRTDICRAYRHGNCPHGLTGKREVNGASCSKAHPRICYRYRKHGSEGPKACAKGMDCKFFHPVICKSSLRKQKCTKTNCTHIHMRSNSKTENVKKKETVPTRSAIKNVKTTSDHGVKKDTKITMLNEEDFRQVLLSQQEVFMKEVKDLRGLITQMGYLPPQLYPSQWPVITAPQRMAWNQPQNQFAMNPAQRMTCPPSSC